MKNEDKGDHLQSKQMKTEDKRDHLQSKQMKNEDKRDHLQSKQMKTEEKGDHLQSKQMKNEDKRDHLQSKKMKNEGKKDPIQQTKNEDISDLNQPFQPESGTPPAGTVGEKKAKFSVKTKDKRDHLPSKQQSKQIKNEEKNELLQPSQEGNKTGFVDTDENLSVAARTELLKSNIVKANQSSIKSKYRGDYNKKYMQ